MKLTVAFIILTVFCSVPQMHELEPHQGSGPVQSSDLNQLIKELYVTQIDGTKYEPGPGVQTKVKRTLVAMAQGSDGLRGEIIQGLILAIEQSEREQLDSRFGVAGWRCAADVLGELRAAEAIDVLVRNLDYEGLVTRCSSSAPLMKAVIKIGELSIPKLAEALSGHNEIIRYRAGQALGEIGGEQGKAALEHALRSEKNNVVIISIERALSLISKNSHKSIK